MNEDIYVKTTSIRRKLTLSKADQELEDVLNEIGWHNVLQIIPCYIGLDTFLYTIIYKSNKVADYE